MKMRLWNNDKDQVQGQEPTGFTKRKLFLFFKIKSKPVYSGQQQQQGQQLQQGQQQQGQQKYSNIQGADKFQYKKPTQLQIYFASRAAKDKGLEEALRSVGVKETPYAFIKKMFIYSVIVSVVIAISTLVLMSMYNLLGYGIVFAGLIGFASYNVLFQRFIKYPAARKKSAGKDVERDILFAARDLVVGLRSGMPLFNAFTAVSTGYGEASKEFARIIEYVQLGMPIEEAIDYVTSRSESKTFRELMLQASASIKAGADVVGALQGAVEDAQQERVIELRRYGQRLNALAMFYMLFGIIFPSMGIAVAAILTTFVSIISITPTTLIFAIIGIFFLQVIFLNVMRGSRPVFTM